MLIPFTKMQAQGNDFVILNYLRSAPPKLDFEEMARWVCDRHFGIGADGLVLISADVGADIPRLIAAIEAKVLARMTIYNADGSRAEICGSALRCVSKLISDCTGENDFWIQTDAGFKIVEVAGNWAVVNLGDAELIAKDLRVGDFTGDLVDIGNLHYIVWTDALADDPHLKHGAFLERHPAFSQPVNVHFAKVLDRNNLEMKIWERGSGATLACGTGAGATVFAGISRGYLNSTAELRQPGGRLRIDQSPISGEMILAGEVFYSFEGRFEWKI